MAITILSAAEVTTQHGVKCLVYGPAGAGKTVSCTTAPKPIIISAEAGLLSIREKDVPVIVVNTIDEVHECYRFLTEAEEAKQFETVCLDSLSEIGEVVLNTEKKKTKDPRQAYGALAEQASDLIRAFRDLPGKNVIMTAKMAREKDDLSGALLYGPSMPGVKLGQSLPYFFDEVFAFRLERDSEGELQRWLQTQPDLQYSAKDRSGALDLYEAPDFAAIFSKISTNEVK